MMTIEIDLAEIVLERHENGLYLWRWDRADMSVVWSKSVRTREEAIDHFRSLIDAMSSHKRMKLYSVIRKLT